MGEGVVLYEINFGEDSAEIESVDPEKVLIILT